MSATTGKTTGKTASGDLAHPEITAENYRIEAKNYFDEGRTSNPIKTTINDDVALGIVNLGPAYSTRQAPALVKYNPRTQTPYQFTLHINEVDFEEFAPEMRAGVVWHELNHILHNHLAMHIKAEEMGMSNTHRLTKAQEIVCNDTVLYHGGTMPWLTDDEQGRKIIYGEDILGYNTYPKNTKEVYDLLEHQDDESCDGSCKGEDDGSCDGTCHDGGEGCVCGHIILIDGDVDLEDINLNDLENAVQDIMAGMKKPEDLAASDSASQGRGLDTDGGIMGLVKNGDVSANWADLLRRIDQRIFSAALGPVSTMRNVADWRVVPNRFQSVRSSGRMPRMIPEKEMFGYGDGLKPALVVAVDQSGSIGEEIARKARELVTTIPQDMVDVHICVFGTQYAHMNPTTGEVSGSYGIGTDFTAVSDFVDQCDTPLGTKVLVFTDGQAVFSQGNPDNLRDYWWVDVFDTKQMVFTLDDNNIDPVFDQVLNIREIVTNW